MTAATIARMYGGEGYARLAHDNYRTPEWVTELLLRHFTFKGPILEPAAGDGDMANELKLHAKVFTADIRKLPDLDAPGADFTSIDEETGLYPKAGGVRLGSLQMTGEDYPHSIITNPPYEHAEDFIRRSLSVVKEVRGKVAMLLPFEYDTALSTRGWMFKDEPFAAKLVLGRRIRWVGFEEKASPRQNHAWFVWDHKYRGSPRIIYA